MVTKWASQARNPLEVSSFLCYKVTWVLCSIIYVGFSIKAFKMLYCWVQLMAQENVFLLGLYLSMSPLNIQSRLCTPSRKASCGAGVTSGGVENCPSSLFRWFWQAPWGSSPSELFHVPRDQDLSPHQKTFFSFIWLTPPSLFRLPWHLKDFLPEFAF